MEASLPAWIASCELAIAARPWELPALLLDSYPNLSDGRPVPKRFPPPYEPQQSPYRCQSASGRESVRP